MTSPVGSFPGLGSGIDYKSLVDQMIQVESAPATTMQSRIDSYNAQISAYKSYSGLLSTLETAAKSLRDGSAFQNVLAAVSNATGAAGRSVVSASASAGAAPGSYAVQVLQTAQAEKLSGETFAAGTSGLGLSGDFVINGKTVTVASSDSLSAIRDKINAQNTGATPTGVSASIITDATNAQRLVLTSVKTGASGINLIDGAQGVAQQLGWIDSTQSIKHVTSAGAQSDNFASATTAIASQLGLASVAGPQTVTIGGQSVSIDLSTDTLNSIAGKLSALSGIQATVQSTTVSGATKYYLDVRNTTSFVDAGNTLGQLGILSSGRGSVAQQLQGAALTAGDATTPATGATLLSNVWNGGAASGVAVGDTLNISGTRGDGSAVNVTFTVAAGSTVNDLLTALNDPTTGFGGGTRPAAASIDASGHIVLTDGTSGQSALSMQIVSNNEGGGRLDLGTFATTTTGRARQLVAGADAKFSVDGVAFTRSSNTVSDVIANTTLTLTAADPTATANVTIDRSATDAKTAVQSYVDAYNAVIDFIQKQQTPGADPSSNPTLYNDSILRSARSSLATGMLTTVGGAAPDLSTVGMAGISLTKDGHLSLDANKFQTAFTNRFDDVETLFMERGSSTNPQAFYSSSTAATQSGTYALNITQAATQATLLGAGFSGTYSDDGTPDVMTVTDPQHSTSVQVQLTNGMTSQQIVDALNTAFTTPEKRVVQTANVMTDATGSTPATSSTLITDLHQPAPAGAGGGAVPGDSITWTGVRPDGTPYSGSFAVGPAAPVSSIVAAVQASLGSTASVSFGNGQFTVTSNTAGNSQVTLSISSDNKGGGQLDFGSTNTIAAGHNAAGLVASVVNNQVQIASSNYGSAAGVSVSFQAGGADGTAQLGLSTTPVNGTDVQGTIGGFAATGSGQSLVGTAGTPVEGLSMLYTGSTLGAVGTMSLTQGMGASIDRLLTNWTQLGGTVDSKEQALNDQVTTQQRRLDDFNNRMDIRRQALLKEYLAMDTAVQKLNSQGNAFLSALSSGSSSSSSSVFG